MLPNNGSFFDVAFGLVPEEWLVRKYYYSYINLCARHA
jgi:hypothetical protein